MLTIQAAFEKQAIKIRLRSFFFCLSLFELHMQSECEFYEIEWNEKHRTIKKTTKFKMKGQCLGRKRIPTNKMYTQKNELRVKFTRNKTNLKESSILKCACIWFDKNKIWFWFLVLNWFWRVSNLELEIWKFDS